MAYTVDTTGNVEVYHTDGLARGGTTTTYSYDRADRITAAGGVGYTVNANGNPTGRGTDSFAYDQANRLKSATIGGATSSYAYDGDGKRASRTVGGATTSYAYDVNRSLPVVLDDGGRKYVWGLGLAYAVQGTAVEVYHTDGLRSVRAVTDGAGTVTQTYQTDEFGVATLTEGTSTQPFGYTGEQRDGESDFMYLRARMYEPGIGRFLQRDPLGGMTSSPGTLNRYGYVGNNPATHADHSGLCADPGGSGVRYCIERYIPDRYAWGWEGDDRRPSPVGGRFKAQQSIYQPAGVTIESSSAGDSMPMGGSALGIPGRQGAKRDCAVEVSKPRVLRGGRIISATCSATHGYMPWAPPIVTSVVILESADGHAQVLSATGTPYPALEIWRYTAQGPDATPLVDYRPPPGTGPQDLYRGANLLRP